ncbi:MAG: hypothetical protein IPG68_16210 [Micrococcales bacterium]|nr:hypothetical protein [Micrococcales bacterium]
MSRILASDTPVKMLVLTSGAYSNTGGQAPTSSFTGQDSDLARFGGSHSGKAEAQGTPPCSPPFHPHVRLLDQHGSTGTSQTTLST